MKKFRWLVVLSVAAIFLLASMSDVFARGGSRGGGSRGGSRSGARSSNKSSNRSSNRAKTQTKRKASTGRAKTAPKRSAVSKKSFETAKKNGTAFKSKSEATAAFKSKNSAKYTSKYTKQPASRPSHIPQTTRVGNTNVNISYNSGYGGYGYMNNVGTWMMYSAMSDAVMMNTLMTRNNYVYGRPPGNYNGLLGVVALLVVGGIVVAIVLANRKQST
ncbi:MAG: hypothetical protein ACTSSP_03060 [Candidatus Asgardarchaeia archaeon]